MNERVYELIPKDKYITRKELEKELLKQKEEIERKLNELEKE